MVKENVIIKKDIILSCILFLTLVPISAVAFSIKQEREIGEKILFTVRKKYTLIDSPDISQYVSTLGDEVLRAAGTQYFDYHFFIIDSPQFNAFATPSGLIFFYSGLIEKMNHENEFISVMAHEVGHIFKRHIADGIQKQKITGAAALATAIIGASIGGKDGSAIITSALATNMSVGLHYSREHEEEADLLSYDWLRKMGRGTEGEIEMLRKMRRIARYRSEKLPQYLLTHPNPEERLNTIQSFIANDKTKQTIRKIDNFNFLRFKYRILVETEESYILRPRFRSIFLRKTNSTEQKIMAEYGLALLAQQEKDYPQALEYLGKVLKNYPDKSILFADKGLIEIEAGMINQALQSLQMALKIDKKNLYATFNIGRLYKKIGDFDNATKYLKSVASTLPTYSQVWFELSELESRRNNDGLRIFYLAQYNLYQGRVKLAAEGFRGTVNSTTASAKIKKKAKEQLARIKRLRKK